MSPLEGVRVLTLALNLPGPLAVARLVLLGATAVKFEPPSGDALADARPNWYGQLHRGVTDLTADLKDPAGRRQLARELGSWQRLSRAIDLVLKASNT